jgi:PiT family inorganic phosphate transporter
MILMLWIFGRLGPGILNTGFKRMQLVSASLMAFSHGSNDAQKAMGIITLALLSAGQIESLEVPTWSSWPARSRWVLAQPRRLEDH